MKITFYGHSCLLAEFDGTRVLIDPFLSGNPLTTADPKQMKVDAIVLTHGHGDHFGDTIEIAKANDCPVISNFEIAAYCEKKGTQAVGMNTGGSKQFDGFKVKFTPALHSSSIQDGDQLLYGGQPMGTILTMGGHTFYHVGDTALFSDLKLIGELHAIDLAAIPIGDHFTMGPDEALLAAQWIGAKHVIPLHYNTFDPIKQDGADYVRRLKEHGITGHALAAGESVDLARL